MDPLPGSSPNPTPKSRQIYGGIRIGKRRALEGSGAGGVMGRGGKTVRQRLTRDGHDEDYVTWAAPGGMIFLGWNTTEWDKRTNKEGSGGKG